MDEVFLQDLPQPRVLLAEDLQINQKVATATLRKIDAVVVVVDNGKDAVETALEAERRGEPFDVILMDMFMPALDGLSATRILREQGYDGSIVALTASMERHDCMEAGCDDFISKPFAPARLLEVVAAYTRPRQT
jgi:CheY-like chemotaxis protein